MLKDTHVVGYFWMKYRVDPRITRVSYNAEYIIHVIRESNVRVYVILYIVSIFVVAIFRLCCWRKIAICRRFMFKGVKRRRGKSGSNIYMYCTCTMRQFPQRIEHMSSTTRRLVSVLVLLSGRLPADIYVCIYVCM